MNGEREQLDPDQVRHLFLATLQVADSKQWQWLEDACQGDVALFDEVWSLLGHAKPVQDPLEDGLSPRAFGQAPSQDVGHHLQVRCPHCQSSINLSLECDLTQVECPSCDSTFNFVRETIDQTHESLPSSGRTIGKFQLLEQVGEGAFGTVYRAHDEELDRLVAIKFPRSSRLSIAERERFLREAQAAGRIRHPNIVGVHEIGLDHGDIYIVSEFIQGVSLKEWMEKQKPSHEQSLGLIKSLADALQYAHDQGVIHRDLKPQNILIDDADAPHITDFGLARRESDDVTMTIAGQLVGTPAYMSPEQARGEGHRVDRRADVYSLGVILFELITGECPFRGTTERVVHQVIHTECPEPRRFDASISQDLNTVCLKCLAKSPSDRYPSATELALDLESLLEGRPVRARPITRVERGWRWCRRHPIPAILGASLATVLFTLGIVGPFIAIRQSRLATDAKASAADAIASEAEAKRESEAARVAQQKAERNARTANARRLARESELIATQRPYRSALLALAAVELNRTAQDPVPPEVMSALHSASMNLGMLSEPEPYGKFCLSSDGKVMFTFDQHGIWRWDLTGNDPLATRKLILAQGDSLTAGEQLIRVSDASVNPMFLSSSGRFLYLAFRYRQWLTRLDLEAEDLASSIQLVEDLQGASTFVVSPSKYGKRVAIASGNEITIWDANSTQQRPLEQTIRFPAEGISELVFSPNAQWLIASTKDKSVRLWNLSAPELEDSQRILAEGVTAELLTPCPYNNWVAWTSETSVFVARLEGESADDQVMQFELANGRKKVKAKSIAFGPGNILAGCTDGQTRIWDLDKEMPQESIEYAVGEANVAAVAAEFGSRFMTLEPDNRVVRVWERRRLGPEEVSQNYFDDWQGITEAGGVKLITRHNSKWLFLTVQDECYGIWRAERERLVLPRIWSHEGRISKLAFTSDGRFLYSISGSYVGRTEPSQLIPNRTARLAFGSDFLLDSQDDLYIRRDKGLFAYEFQEAGEDDRLLLDLDKAEKVAMSPDGKWFFIGTTVGAIRQVKRGSFDDSGEESLLEGHTEAISCLAISRDSRWLVSASEDKTVRLWDLISEDVTGSSKVIGTTPRGVRDFAISPDGRWGYCVEFLQGNWSFRTLVDLKRQASIQLRAEWLDSGSDSAGLFSEDGRWFVCDGVLWDVMSLREAPRSFQLGHLDDDRLSQATRVTSLAFSADSTRLAVSDASNDVRVWDLTKIDDSPDSVPQCITILKHPKPVTCAVFHPDGDIIATGSSDSLVRLWNLDVERLIEDVSRRSRRELTEEEKSQFRIE